MLGLDVKLSAKFSRIKKVDKYLSERELQKGDVFSYNFKQKEKDLELLRSIKHK